MRSLGLVFEVDASDAPEVVDAALAPGEVVSGLAVAKALAVAPRHAGSLVIAADTLVWLDGRLYGKPADIEDARRILGELSGACHRVYTGLVLLDTVSGAREERVVETDVSFRKLPAVEIEAYVATREPYDKAGAYGMQGLGAVFIDRIDGDASNVIGLPLGALNELLRGAGCCVICRAVAEFRG